jgi:hypothetical protein
MPGAFEASFAAQTCASPSCVNDSHDGVTQSLPNRWSGETSIAAPTRDARARASLLPLGSFRH